MATGGDAVLSFLHRCSTWTHFSASLSSSNRLRRVRCGGTSRSWLRLRRRSCDLQQRATKMCRGSPSGCGTRGSRCYCSCVPVSSMQGKQSAHTQCSYYIKSPRSRHARNHNVASTLHSTRQQQCLRSNFPARTCYALARVRAHLHQHHCSWVHPEQAPLRAPVPVQRGRPQVPLPRALAFHLRRKICTSHKDQAAKYSRRVREVGDEVNSACPSPTCLATAAAATHRCRQPQDAPHQQSQAAQ
jgi:hypothetical protein